MQDFEQSKINFEPNIKILKNRSMETNPLKSITGVVLLENSRPNLTILETDQVAGGIRVIVGGEI